MKKFLFLFVFSGLVRATESYLYTRIPVAPEQALFGPASSLLKKADLNIAMSSYIAGIKAGILEYNLPGLSVKLLNFNSGKMAYTDSLGNKLGEFSTNHLMFGVSKKHVIRGTKVQFGVDILYQSIKDRSSMALTLELGFMKELPNVPLKLGIEVHNLGIELSHFEKKTYNPVPFIDAGVLYSKSLKLGAGVELSKDRFDFYTGIKWPISRLLAFSFGFSTLPLKAKMEGSSSFLMGFGFGLNLTLKRMELAYLYNPYQPLGDVHRIGLSYNF